MRAQTCHPLDPLSAAEISVAVATVWASGATPEVRDSMRFVEVVLVEPDKQVVALADAYFFPPFQPSLHPRTKGGPVIPTKLPPTKAQLVVYNKRSTETSIWIVELTELKFMQRLEVATIRAKLLRWMSKLKSQERIMFTIMHFMLRKNCLNRNWEQCVIVTLYLLGIGLLETQRL